MNLTNVMTAIRSRLTTDTGTGGLFNAASPLLSQVYSVRAGTVSPTANYIVLNPTTVVQTDDFTNDVVDMSISASVYMGNFDGQGDTFSTIVDRVFARLHRWTPTLTTWTAAGPMLFQDAGSPDLPDVESLQYIMNFLLKQSKES